MKKLHKCLTGSGTELWVYAYTWFGAAMTAFGAQGATHVKGNGKDGGKVEYTGGKITREFIRERADQTVEDKADDSGFVPDVIAVEVEGYALDARGDLVHESDLDPETHLEQTYAKVHYGVYLVFEGVGRDGVADFALREDAETAQEELITYFGLDAPTPPEEET